MCNSVAGIVCMIFRCFIVNLFSVLCIASIVFACDVGFVALFLCSCLLALLTV